MGDSVDSTTLAILAYMALEQLDRNPSVNCFVFTKAKFTGVYIRLARLGVVGFRKWETLYRNLRKYAEEGRFIRYVDREKGIYETCISSLEEHPLWNNTLERVRNARDKHVLKIEIDDETFDKLVKLAVAKSKSIQDILVEAVKTYLEVTK